MCSLTLEGRPPRTAVFAVAAVKASSEFIELVLGAVEVVASYLRGRCSRSADANDA